MATAKQIDSILLGYQDAALWTTDSDETGYALDRDYGPDDFTEKTVAKMRADIEAFVASLPDDLPLDDIAALYEPVDGGPAEEWIGHDLWLDRAGHGVGFWDRSWLDRDGIGDRLSELAKKLGYVDIYVGDDDQVYQTGAE